MKGTTMYKPKPAGPPLRLCGPKGGGMSYPTDEVPEKKEK